MGDAMQMLFTCVTSYNVLKYFSALVNWRKKALLHAFIIVFDENKVTTKSV